MNVWRGILTACTLSASAAAIGQGGLYENSVAIVTSYAQRPDFDAPWKKAPVRTDQHIGTLELVRIFWFRRGRSGTRRI